MAGKKGRTLLVLDEGPGRHRTLQAELGSWPSWVVPWGVQGNLGLGSGHRCMSYVVVLRKQILFILPPAEDRKRARLWSCFGQRKPRPPPLVLRVEGHPTWWSLVLVEPSRYRQWT